MRPLFFFLLCCHFLLFSLVFWISLIALSIQYAFAGRKVKVRIMTKLEEKRVLPLFSACTSSRDNPESRMMCPPLIFRDINHAKQSLTDSAPDHIKLEYVVLSGFFDPYTGLVHPVPKNKSVKEDF